jgi:hypothetical protein
MDVILLFVSFALRSLSPSAWFRSASAAVVLMFALPLDARAQSASDSRRFSVASSLDLGFYPHVLDDHGEASDCSSGEVGVGAGVSAIVRPGKLIVASLEFRESAIKYKSDCVNVVQALPGVRPGGYYPLGPTPGLPLARTLAHIGLETPPSFFPILRAMIGGGAILQGHPTPVGAFTAGMSSNGKGARWFLEAEYDVTRVHESEDLFLGYADTISFTPITALKVRVSHPTWSTLRAGVEWPLK